MQGQRLEALMEVGSHHAEEALFLSMHVSGEPLAFVKLGTGISFMAHRNGFCDHGPSPSTRHVPAGGTPCGHPVSGSTELSVGAARWAELVSQATA